jgi:hypothetical protein
MRIISSLEAGTMFTGAGPSEAVPAMQEAPRMRTPQGQRMAEVLNARRKTMTDAMYTRALKELQQREDAGHYGPATEEVGIPGMGATGRGGGISNQPAPHIFWRQDGKPFMQVQDSRGPRLVEVPMEEAGGAGSAGAGAGGPPTPREALDWAMQQVQAEIANPRLGTNWFYDTPAAKMERIKQYAALYMQMHGVQSGRATSPSFGPPRIGGAPPTSQGTPPPSAALPPPVPAETPPNTPLGTAPPVVPPVIPPATPSPPAPPPTRTVGEVVGQTQAGAWADKTIAEFTAALRANPQDPVLRPLGQAVRAAGY